MVIVFTVVVLVLIMMIIMIVEVAVSFVVRVVVVFNAAAVALPVAGVISFAIVARFNPMCSLIRWPSPIAFVPFVMLAHRIPISRHSHAPRSRTWGNNCNNPRWRRGSDNDSY
jgi:hypothetical protein